MACYREILPVANTIKKLHIQSYLYYDYINIFYYDKQWSIDDLFYHYHLTLLKDIDHHSFIQ